MKHEDMPSFQGEKSKAASAARRLAMIEKLEGLKENSAATDLRKKETHLRKRLAENGYILKKTPPRHRSRKIHGIGYMVIEADRNYVVLGSTHWPYDADIYDVEAFLAKL